MERLLSLIFETNIVSYALSGTNVTLTTSDGSTLGNYNVHELAFMSKVWAAQHGYEVFSTVSTCFVTELEHTDILIRFDGKKEYLAICLACQWVSLHGKGLK